MIKKSLKKNAALNVVKTIVSIIFPLITFPYVSRILQVENLGKINFSNSIVSYFSLIAALGVSTYAIREGAALRNNKKEFALFANQIFTINILSTIVSYLLLVTTMVFVPKLQNYVLLIIIQSTPIIFNTLGVNWINSIYEDYLYITLRSILVQFVSLILLFLLVKTQADYYLYALVTVISIIGGNIFNYFYSRKYCRIKLTKNLDIKKNIKPILIIFSIDIASSIYLNSDMTMLGLFVGNKSVGLYSVSVKIYTIIKSIISSIIIVTLPRLSLYLKEGRIEKYNKILNNLFNFLLLLVLPLVTGLNILCDELIVIISGNNYIEANTSLRILSIALIFSTFASIINYCILIPLKKEKYVLRATIISAVVNIFLNFILIQPLQQNGAALTTLFSELLVFVIAYYYARDFIKIKDLAKNLITSIIGCIAIILLAILLKQLISNMILFVILTAACSVILYGAVLLLVRNDLACDFARGFLKR